MTEGRHIWISGRVQGVGYRWFACQAARARGISGWVRNIADGRVELFAQATPALLDNLVEALREGPPAARVESVRWDPTSEETVPTGNASNDFEIRP